jgi:hypothetical protein
MSFLEHVDIEVPSLTQSFVAKSRSMLIDGKWVKRHRARPS